MNERSGEEEQEGGKGKGRREVVIGISLPVTFSEVHLTLVVEEGRLQNRTAIFLALRSALQHR